MRPRSLKKGKKTETARASFPRSWPDRLRDGRWTLAVCGLAFLVYSRSLFCGFVRDDTPQILRNRQVQSWEYLPQLLGTHLWSQLGQEVNVLFYRPIFSIWMLLVHTFGGLDPWFWHFSSILLHVVATYLVFRLCQRLTRSDIGAAAAAAIFAVHPIHVDAVTWVSASCEVLFAIFALAAMLVLLNDDKHGKPRVWISAALYCAGLFAKETGIAMLPILLVLAWAQRKDRVDGGRLRRFWEAAYPYGALTGAYLLVRWITVHRVGVETGEHSWTQVIFRVPTSCSFTSTNCSCRSGSAAAT